MTAPVQGRGHHERARQPGHVLQLCPFAKRHVKKPCDLTKPWPPPQGNGDSRRPDCCSDEGREHNQALSRAPGTEWARHRVSIFHIITQRGRGVSCSRIHEYTGLVLSAHQTRLQLVVSSPREGGQTQCEDILRVDYKQEQ